MLHLGDDLTGDLEFGRDPVEAVAVQPDDRFGDHGGGVELVGDRDPVLALESTFRKPAAELPPKARRMRALATDVGRTFDRQQWHNIIEEIESAIETIRKTGPRSVERDERLNWLSQAAQEFFHFRQYPGQTLGILFGRFGRGAGLSDDADIDLRLIRFGGYGRFARDGNRRHSRPRPVLLRFGRRR